MLTFFDFNFELQTFQMPRGAKNKAAAKE